RHTRSKRDWSSDVCSSDLRLYLSLPAPKNEEEAKYIIDDNKTFEDTSSWSDEERKAKSDAMKKNNNADKTSDTGKSSVASETLRSEERRVGKECRSWWWRK